MPIAKLYLDLFISIIFVDNILHLLSDESSKAKCRNDLPMALRFSKRAKYVNIAGIAISFVTFLILILICVGSSYDETHLHYFFVNHD